MRHATLWGRPNQGRILLEGRDTAGLDSGRLTASLGLGGEGRKLTEQLSGGGGRGARPGH